MTIRIATLLWLLAVCLQSQTARLATADTELTFDVTPAGPRLSRLGTSWENRASEALINHVEIGGVSEPIRWHFVSQSAAINRREVRFVFQSRDPKLRLSWEWKVRASNGPVEHSIRIENLTGTEIWLPLQDSFAFNFKVPASEQLRQFYVEKGASSPSEIGTHSVNLADGYEWTGTSSTYAHPPKKAPREIIPYVLVYRDNSQRDGWYSGIEFSGRTRLTLARHGDSLSGVTGLNPTPGSFRSRLKGGETFETPIIFLGAFKGGPDGAGNILRRWVREVLNNPLTIRNTNYPMLVSNSWGTGMAINEGQAHRMIGDASGLGLEMFHLDAGWFRNVGDWQSNPDKFPHGVESVADYAHQLGLKFGLWTDWTQAGLHNVRDPEIRPWLTTDAPADWKPEEFKGITVDIGVPAAKQWALQSVSKVVSRFHLDMLEHDGYLVAQGCDRPDHPHAPLDPTSSKNYKDEGFLWVEGSNDTDVSYHATRAYYEIQARLRKQFPALLLEICNDGGRMVDFGSAAHGDYFSTSDGYDPLSNRRAFFDASYVLPPAMLESYVEKWPTNSLDNFRYMLRSGMLGWFSLMMDSSIWTSSQRQTARAEFVSYKTKLRPLIRNADLYHVSSRPDGVHWDGIEYFDPASDAGVLFAFRGSSVVDHAHTFPVHGLQANHQYRITFHDHTSAPYTASGERLMQSGVTVQTVTPDSSELVFLEGL